MRYEKPVWTPPSIDVSNLDTGEMPGDKIKIDENHIARANIAFPVILRHLTSKDTGRFVVSVYGGSGVGKSEIGSILTRYCEEAGFPAYMMSGDNYPRRYPNQNNIERLNTYRDSGLAAMASDTEFKDEWDDEIRSHWPTTMDFHPSLAINHRGFSLYQNAGRAALSEYLGTKIEIDFNLVNSIIKRFKAGKTRIPLKRMGRSHDDICFRTIDFSNIRVLILEWTHGNSPFLRGVDFPIFLYSSPMETLEHRRSRGRDADTDSPFVQLLLEIEQSKLNTQASKAALIIGKNGAIIPQEQFQAELK